MECVVLAKYRQGCVVGKVVNAANTNPREAGKSRITRQPRYSQLGRNVIAGILLDHLAAKAIEPEARLPDRRRVEHVRL